MGLAVAKVACPSTVPYPGGDVTYTIKVRNTQNEPVIINSISDNVYGDLATYPTSTCGALVGQILGSGQQTQCTFVAPVIGNAGSTSTDTVVVGASGVTGGLSFVGVDSATVTIGSAIPFLNASVDPQVAKIDETITVEACLSSPVTATGTLTFSLYSIPKVEPGCDCGCGPTASGSTAFFGCTGVPAYTATVAVVEAGRYRAKFRVCQKGKYQAFVSYSGDAFNTPANTVCGNKCLQVKVQSSHSEKKKHRKHSRKH